jgi:hypothetical protein
MRWLLGHALDFIPRRQPADAAARPSYVPVVKFAAFAVSGFLALFASFAVNRFADWLIAERFFPRLLSSP